MKLINKFSFKKILDENSSKNFRYLEHVNRIYGFKKDLATNPNVVNSNWRDFLLIQPLLSNVNLLSNAIFQGKKKLSSFEEETIDSNIEKFHNLENLLSNYNEDLPKTFLINSSNMETVEDYIKKFQNLNEECIDLSEIKNRNSLVCDICMGGTHYLVSTRNNKINAYSKLVSLVIEDKLYLQVNSTDSHDTNLSTPESWFDSGLSGEFLALFYGSVSLGRIFPYQGILFRSNESSNFSKDLGISQKRFQKVKGKSIHELKAGVVHKSTSVRGIYTSFDSRNRFLSRNDCTVSRHSLDTNISALLQLDNLNPLQEQYLQYAKNIYDKL